MPVSVCHGWVEVRTKGFNDIINITPQVRQFVKEKHLKEGQLLIFINGSTAAISTVEYEPGLLQDIPEMMEKIAPMNRRYHHDDTWHDGNGYAHLRSTLTGTSFTVPVIDGQLVLGTWQQIILLDFDNTSRQRRVALQFVGEME
ncbi:secondary thiamine-phosphate synthase enzyme YjbQ [Caldithrix abyssi]